MMSAILLPVEDDDAVFALWVTLIEIKAAVDAIDITSVPDCVWHHYFGQDLTVGEALDRAR